MDGWMGFLLNLVVLLWCMPIWIYGCAAAGDVPVYTVFTAILIPVLLMVSFTAWGTYSSMETMKTITGTSSSGGMRFSMRPGG